MHDIFFTIYDFLKIVIKRIASEKLTKIERIVLKVAAENDGNIYILSNDQTGEFVKIGKSNKLPYDEGYQRLAYVEAVRSLVEKGYAIHTSKKLYNLTAKGFKRALKV